MWIQKLKQVISFSLIFFLLFSFTLRIPTELFFASKAYAGDKEFYNLVSIIVDEESYDEIKSKLVRYSRDIQGVLENTRVVILPTPSDASVLDIASLNESLYFEGYKAHKNVNYESRLIGTVLVGKIPVPVVFDEKNSGKSILPYVDFENKAYIFDHESGKYEKSETADTKITPEIWHGVISPNTGNSGDDIQAIQDYFDKNHDFYSGQGVFDQEKGVIDGQDIAAEDDYEPQVFYYDQFRENEALQYQKYTGYEMYMQNIEDITYNRYSKDLAKRVSDQVLGTQNADIQDLLIAVDPEFDISGIQSGPDVSSSSDILTRYVTDNSTKKFLEIFNGSTLGEMRKHVYNAGRYNDGGGKVNVDMPPFLVSVLDQVSGEIIKNVNTSLENEITDIVTNGLSRNIEIPVRKEGGCGPSYENFYYGLGARGITNAAQCSIYKGNTNSAGVLVEANRGRNINLTQSDTLLCSNKLRVNNNTGKISQGIQSLWAGNTPINLAGSDYTTNSGLNLGEHNPQNSYIPVYDIMGSLEIFDETKNPSPIDCFEDGVYLQVSKKEEVEHTYSEGSGEDKEEKTHTYCATRYTINVPDSGVVRPLTDIDYYRSTGHDDGHDYVKLVSKEQSLKNFCTQSDITQESIRNNLSASETKYISSHILHTSPTDEEFGAQTRSLFTPSLPIDSDRYIDFIGAKGGDASQDYGYQRIDFPQLFRVQASGDDISLEAVEGDVKDYLDSISDQMNRVIQDANPGSIPLSVDESTGEYPSANIDLYDLLKSKPLEIFTLDNQSKEISYFDTLVFAVFWNNLDTVSSKYKFIFQEYLSNEFEGNDYNFHLPKAKKSYELAYMAAPGDAQNMYVKLDPEMKGVHPYADIISQNIALQTTINAGNIGNPDQQESDFKCAPPGGVNIFQWIPAVICWLKEMLPPNIDDFIGEGDCGDETLFLSEEEEEEIRACSIDENKNGVSDCIEQKIAGGSLKILADAGKYFYNSSGILISEIFTQDGKLARFDSSSYIAHSLSRVVIPTDSEEIFDENNSTVIYDVNIPTLATQEARNKAAKYIGFSEIELRAHRGGTKTYFYTKGLDANIYFESSLKTLDAEGNTIVDLESNLLELQVRGDRIFMSSYQVDGPSDYIADNAIIASHEANICLVDGGEKNIEQSSIEADTLSQAKEKLLLLIQNISQSGNQLALNYPLSVELIYNNERVFYEDDLRSEDLEKVYSLLHLSKAGEYEMHIRDSDGFHTYRVFHILPEKATKIETTLGSNIIETGGNISTHIVTVMDRYDNAATGDIYTIEMSLDGGGLVFEDNGEDEIEYHIVEGYKAFRLKSTSKADNNTLSITVKDISGNVIEQESHTVRTIDEISLDFSLSGNTPRVGGEIYSYDIAFRDEDGNILTDLNSRVYFGINKIYGHSLPAYTQVVEGQAQVSFQSSTLAGQNINVELQLEGGNDIYNENISILPDVAVTIDLKLSSDKIEASADESAILEATLKDRYNNDVFTDNTTNLTVEIHEKSQDIIGVDSVKKVTQEGKVQFQISGTDIPGLGYFKVSADPDLSQNSFELVGQAPFAKDNLVIPTMVSNNDTLTDRGNSFYKEYSDSKYISKFISSEALTQSEVYKSLPGVLQAQVLDFWSETNSLTVSGLGENAGSIETFFFWDSDDIAGNSYNSMYSVLLGAPYGDISQERYLGGEILFDRDNSALAVSSLLNTPYKFHDSVSFENNGHLSITQSGDITQDIQALSRFDSQGRLVLDIYNNALKDYVGRAYYNLSNASDISISVDEELGYKLEPRGDDAVIISPLGQLVFEAYEGGRFERHSGLTTQLDTDFSGKGIAINLLIGGLTIGQVHILADLKTNVTRDENVLEAKLQSLDDTIIVYIASNAYSSRNDFVDGKNNTLKIYYQDPFANKYVLDDFHNNDDIGFESSLDESGIGWQDSNTMLLDFAGGERVGDASKHFHSFSLINLGDPVASLKPLTNTFKNSTQEKSFDSTLGETIDASDGLIGYQVLDYNNDEKKDILTIHRDGYVALHENDDIEGGFIFQRNLVFAADGGSVKMVKTGDFSGDGYDDIFFVTDKGQPALYNNHEKDFYRYDIADQMSLSGAIIQAETYDMDSDGKDDIITLDDAGEIHIFYGNGSSQNPDFTKKFIGDGYAIELSDSTMSHGGGVYYDGLIQLSDERAADILLNSQEYLTQLSESLDDGNEGEAPEFIDESLVESFLYMSLPYVPTNYENPLTNQEIVEESLGDDASVSNFLNNYSDYTSYSGFENAYNVNTYFLRSQYADKQGIEITKTFTDTTPPYLQTGDSVYYDISIKNTSSTRKNNIAYVDSIPQYFHFAGQDLTILTQDNLSVPRKVGIDQYEILLDGFFLDPGEETIVRYELTTLPLSYGYMQVGLYEDGEVGDDIYGDIILKDDEKNCGKQADIYRSTAIRSYSAGTTIPNCESSDIEVGNNFPKLSDEDNNGVPDYIDDLVDASDDIESDEFQAVLDYGEKIREELGLDTDGDGIPDSDDAMDNTDSATDFMGALDNINESIDEISEDIDELIQGLSCGFGGGSCIASPLNWAPLAPGQDPTLFGKPIGDGLKVGEGVPIFSALTGVPVPVFGGCIEVPAAWPMSPHKYDGACGGPNGAGGKLGTNSPTNFVRMFATPTLTGGFGIAVCFGGPASVAGNSVPMGVSPIIPGGNCIVAAMPLMSCEGGEGDPGVLGYPYPGNGYGLIHANCDGTTQNDLHTPLELESNFVLDYLNYLKTGVQPDSMYDNYVDAFSTLSSNRSGDYYLPSEPLINIGGGGDSSMSLSVSLDTSALGTGNFDDIVQVKNKRVAAFPGFMMDWVERQLDEVTSKLTNLPKVSVILPDFGGLFDGSFSGFGSGLSESFQEGKNKSENQRETGQNQLDALKTQKSSLDCSGADALQCKTLDLKIIGVKQSSYADAGKETLSGIREVYEFIGNIPLIDLETETIAVNVPWIEPAAIDRALVDWNASLNQWKEQARSKSEAWSGGATCSGTQSEIARCQSENDIKKKAYADVEDFVASLEQNIQTLQEYKEFPDKLAKLINIKEVWLEQILCNIEAISSLMGEWVSSNGERFKAWVELYILIKAILKSWQLFIDVFAGYEAECHECKNERGDLQDFTFQLISAVIPSAPIIQFPKWPDIILDLHNIRAGMTVYMPDFDINLRPIVLPTLPLLGLPDVPSLGFTLPAMPQLPRFELPEMPILKTLPSVELPDLPPPPKIPKLFGSVEAVLNIMKLITKAMCILKGSPFVPEWRAGDQIAFLTERNGYLPTDFIDVQPPAFSYSAISAIKITTYVNLEFEMEFILEAVRSITAPLDKISNNIANMLDISLSNIDLSEAVPSDINFDIQTDGDVETNISLAPLNENPEGILLIAGLISSKLTGFIDYMGDNAQVTMTNREFKQYIGSELAQSSVTSDPRTKELQNLWSEVFALSYSAEDEFIAKLQENNRTKFQTLEDIISTEIEYGKQQQKTLDEMGSPEFIVQVSDHSDGRISAYNTLLEPYNIKTLDSAISLVSPEETQEHTINSELQAQGDALMKQVRGGLTSYKNNALLAAQDNTASSASAGGGSCHSNNSYEYVYEGIYVLEDGKNYKLFDYTDNLRGDEELTLSDLDNDGDDDVLYLMKGKLYFKENRKIKTESQHLSLPPLILESDDNVFYNGDIYHEAINGFSEASVSDGAINIEFQSPTDSEIKNFRMEYHTIVDRYLDEDDSFTPESVETHIVDAIADMNTLGIINETPDYTISNNLATLSYAGGMNGIKLTNDKLQNLRDQLEDNVLVTLTSGTAIYASDNDFEISYQIGNGEAQTLRVEQYNSISFINPVKILSLSGNAYVSMGISQDIKNTDIIDYIGMPLLPGAHIEYTGNTDLLDESSHIDIRYYDGSELQMDMRDIGSFRLYDLGESYERDYRIRLEIPNDFYYARLHGFKNGVDATLSKQILLAPQIYSDTLAPQIGLTQKIRIPVYQSQKVDLTPYIYEDGGLSGISDVRVDFDLAIDSDGDGNTQNDADTDNINISRSAAKIEIEFGPYDTLFEKNIIITLEDDNGNIGSREIGFEVYPPKPKILEIENDVISGIIDEDLLGEPVRLYRYRGGIIQKLQASDGADLIQTDVDGNYDFETTENSDGLALSYSGTVIANIDEYTGRIDTLSALVNTKVFASNDPLNSSIYPEIQVLRLATPIFRQFVKIPEGEVSNVSNFNSLKDTGIYIKLLSQEKYSSFRIPLGVAYNPGSFSVYLSTDETKTPVMTIFKDGRIDIDQDDYKLEYRTLGEDASLVLVEKTSGEDIAQIVYHMNASYVLR